MPITPASQKVRPPALDATDLAILAELEENGRLTNAALAARVGIAESTCTGRLRALRESGVITRFRADVDPAALGLPLQAVVRVRLSSHNRDQVHSFHAILREIPGALAIFHVGGEDDYLIHVAVESASALRDLVLEHVNVHPAVRHTETQLVFEVIRGAGVLSRVRPRSGGPEPLATVERLFDHGGVILHADLDSFYASVEQRDDPRLRGRPVIVGGGVVLAASYEAKAYGVRSAMGGREAARLCPGALVVPPRFPAYVEASRQVFAIFEDTTPLVEGLSIDEAFLDVGGLRRLVGEPEAIAVALRGRVRDEVGLPISVGIARTKYLAKVASAVSKPDGLRLVPPDAEEQFLHPLPVERLWGVGAVTAAKLHADGIRTIGELARREEVELTATVGRAAGRHLWALANLLDPRPVEVGRRRRSIGSQCAIGRPGRRKSRAELEALLAGLVDRVARRLRAGERIGQTFTLRLRFDDFGRATRSATLAHSSAATATWLETGRRLLDAAWPLIEERGCTLLGVTISGLVDGRSRQLELPLFPDVDAESGLDAALDRVRRRYGGSAVTRAALVGRHTGLEMPTLPDPGPGVRSG